MDSVINVENYRVRRDKGDIVVQKVGEIMVASIKTYDQLTGEPTTQLVPISYVSLQETRDKYQKVIDEITALMADIEAKMRAEVVASPVTR